MKLWLVSLLTVLAFALSSCGHMGTDHGGHDCKSSGQDCAGKCEAGKCESGKCEDGKCDLKKKKDCDKGKCDLKKKGDSKGCCKGSSDKTDAAAPVPTPTK